MKSRVRNSFQTASGAPGDSVEPPTGEAAPPTPRFLLAQAILFLRRNLVRIGAISVLVAALAFGASLLFLAKYSATAVIVVDARATKAAQAGAGALPNISLDNSSVESLAVIAKSEQFLGELVDKLDLVHDPDFAGRGRTEQEARAATVEKLGARLYVARRGTTYVLE
ncbi:MAG: Wzz/FepE/Etk N-terminal domain-containing protein, partial [Methylocystis sp.]